MEVEVEGVGESDGLDGGGKKGDGEDSVGDDESVVVVDGGADILFRRCCKVLIAVEELMSGCAPATIIDSPRGREVRNWVVAGELDGFGAAATVGVRNGWT